MVNESRTFGATVALTVVGLGIMLYGVSLNDGQALNAVMGAGSVVLVVALGVLTAGIMFVEDQHADAEADPEA